MLFRSIAMKQEYGQEDDWVRQVHKKIIKTEYACTTCVTLCL
jgi:hypothetical protein